MTRNFYARLAGFMFLAGIGEYFAADYFLSPETVTATLPGPFPIFLPPEVLQRIGLVLLLSVNWGTIILSGALYTLLKPIAPALALTGFAWRIVEVALSSASTLALYVKLTDNAEGANLPNQWLERSLDLFRTHCTSFAELFFAAGSTCFFALFLKSTFIPRFLSAWGVLSSIAIGFLAIASVILSPLPPQLEYAGLPILIGEAATGIWLLLFGAGPGGNVRSAPGNSDRQRFELAQ